MVVVFAHSAQSFAVALERHPSHLSWRDARVAPLIPFRCAWLRGIGSLWRRRFVDLLPDGDVRSERLWTVAHTRIACGQGDRHGGGTAPLFSGGPGSGPPRQSAAAFSPTPHAGADP